MTQEGNLSFGLIADVMTEILNSQYKQAPQTSHLVGGAIIGCLLNTEHRKETRSHVKERVQVIMMTTRRKNKYDGKIVNIDIPAALHSMHCCTFPTELLRYDLTELPLDEALLEAVIAYHLTYE